MWYHRNNAITQFARYCLTPLTTSRENEGHLYWPTRRLAGAMEHSNRSAVHLYNLTRQQRNENLLQGNIKACRSKLKNVIGRCDLVGLLDSDAVVTLPGGSGTFEEVFEVLTLKRLGAYLGPIVLVNTNNYFDRLVDFLEHSVNERFMSQMHLEMWSLVDEPEQVFDAMFSATEWSRDARKFASVPR